ncbi:hypothetical protein E2I00_015365 [Balaenoptera physalus]|uniref:Male-enhanced antigen 1 n=1 Tax=Balaenoptera physalus TaxID=9770 RepID=A0A643CA53_BALPH|nr:hypothetical protein E2I00_015365 [Balaenoptera physalus]
MRQVSLDEMVNDGERSDAGTQHCRKEWARGSDAGSERHLPDGSSSSGGETPWVLKVSSPLRLRNSGHTRAVQKALGIGAALGFHFPDPPLESEDAEEEGATALSNHSSIPMDPERVELVKRTMAGVSLPVPGVPAWARERSDVLREDVRQKVLQAGQAAPAWK